MTESRKNIAIIGPVYPYKGGISHYTSLMAKNLSKDFEVTVISFKKLYPKFLFRQKQKDFSEVIFKVENTKYLINTTNPFSWQKSANYINHINPDIVIFQWWHPYFFFCYRYIIQFIKNKNILFVYHNVFPHENFPFAKTITKLLLTKGDYFILHSNQDVADLCSIYPSAKYRKTVHPTYNTFKFTGINKSEARENLGIAKNVKILLFFGFVREYKGLIYLINAFPQICKELDNCLLLIVGEFREDKSKYINLIDELGIAQNVKIIDNYVPDQEIENIFMSSDLVILPYISSTQSGIVQIAFGFEKPVIVTNVGGLPEVVKNGITGYVVEPKDSDAIAQATIKFFKENKAEIFSENINKESYKYSWDHMNEIINSFLL